jgi:hypothetical protein
MNLSDITVVVGIDAQYIEKLFVTLPTWVKYKPEIVDMPFRFIYDDAKHNEHGLGTAHPIYGPTWSGDPHPLLMKLNRLCHTLGIRDKGFCQWNGHGGYESQRAKMLNGLVFATALHVKTPWYLKLDADTYANRTTKWLEPNWFVERKDGYAAFIASPWGYTKPADALDRLDDWGDTVDGLKDYPRLNIPYEKDATRVCSNRMASWVMFGNTAWLRKAIKFCTSRGPALPSLPVPSQDTFLYYVAARLGDPYITAKMKNMGWAHASKLSNLKRECEALA